MSNETQVKNLLSGIEFDDPRLYTLIDLLSSDFYKLNSQINPPTTAVSRFTGQLSAPSQVTVLTATLFNNNLRLAWPGVSGVSTYEIRYLLGEAGASSWDLASTILKTSTLSADINPISIPLVFGHHTFFIKSVDNAGTYSENASVITINIPKILAPTVTPVIIGNFILLYWTAPSSTFLIEHYNVYKDGVFQGKMNGTFETIFETVGGTYNYTVEAVDIVGNIGQPSVAAVVTVSDPLDFTLHATITSTFTGSKSNCYVESIGGRSNLLAIINPTQTFQDHFDTHSWASPQAQVSAGYPIYIQPAGTTGSYTEVFDFGSIVSNVIVVVNWNTMVITGAVTVSATLETSTDNVTYTAPATTTRLFAANVRYVRLVMNFSSADDLSLSYYYNLECLLNVHREQDGGVINCIKTDTGGTTVTLNKAFKQLDSITLSPKATADRRAVFDFTFSTLNPTTFKVLLYDTGGARETGDVGWIARGIM